MDPPKPSMDGCARLGARLEPALGDLACAVAGSRPRRRGDQAPAGRRPAPSMALERCLCRRPTGLEPARRLDGGAARVWSRLGAEPRERGCALGCHPLQPRRHRRIAPAAHCPAPTGHLRASPRHGAGGASRPPRSHSRDGHRLHAGRPLGARPAPDPRKGCERGRQARPDRPGGVARRARALRLATGRSGAARACWIARHSGSRTQSSSAFS